MVDEVAGLKDGSNTQNMPAQNRITHGRLEGICYNQLLQLIPLPTGFLFLIIWILRSFELLGNEGDDRDVDDWDNDDVDEDDDGDDDDDEDSGEDDGVDEY